MSLATSFKRSASALINAEAWESRGSEDDEQGNNAPESKKPKYSWYVTLESETPDGTSDDESDNESIYSVQDHETEYVRDTSDTSRNTWVSSDNGDMSVQVEYEVASMSESDNPFFNSLSSSDPEDIQPQRIFVALCESDVDQADNSSDSRSSFDSEIGRADYWTCVHCSMKNNNPLFPYCEKCYQIRKNFFPPRPKWKRRRSKNPLESSTKSSDKQNVLRNPQEELVKMDSGLGSSQGSQSISEFDSESVMSSQCTNTILTASPSFLKNSVNVIDSRLDPTKTSISKDSPSDDESFARNKIDLMQERLKTEDDADNFCNMCTVRPKDGAFVHGRASHVCCCYKCAIKTWKTTKYCPICNRKVRSVSKLYFV